MTEELLKNRHIRVVFESDGKVFSIKRVRIKRVNKHTIRVVSPGGREETFSKDRFRDVGYEHYRGVDTVRYATYGLFLMNDEELVEYRIKYKEYLISEKLTQIKSCESIIKREEDEMLDLKTRVKLLQYDISMLKDGE
jgi:hypothetical protein